MNRSVFYFLCLLCYYFDSFSSVEGAHYIYVNDKYHHLSTVDSTKRTGDEKCEQEFGNNFVEYEASYNFEVINIMEILQNYAIRYNVSIKSRISDCEYFWLNEPVNDRLWFTYADEKGVINVALPSACHPTVLRKMVHGHTSISGMHMLAELSDDFELSYLCVGEPTATTKTTDLRVPLPPLTTITTTAPETTSQTSIITEETTSQRNTTTEGLTAQASITTEEMTPQTNITTDGLTSQASTTTEETTSQNNTTTEGLTAQASIINEEMTSQTNITTDGLTSQTSTTTEETTSQNNTTTEGLTAQASITTEEMTPQTNITTDGLTSQASTTTEETTSQNNTTTEVLTSQDSTSTNETTTRPQHRSTKKPPHRVHETVEVKVCPCTCSNDTNTKHNITESQLQELTAVLQRNLTIAKDNLSTAIRKKSSAPDARASSQIAGVIGVFLLALAFGTLLLFDLIGFVRFVCAHFKSKVSQV